MLGLAAALVLLALAARTYVPIVPTSPPFPARYALGSSSATEFAEFRADGTVVAQNLPLWGGENCPEHPARISGEGRWYQDWSGLWIDIAGQRARWDPGLYRGWPTWEKIVLQYCATAHPEQEVWYLDSQA